MKLTMERHDESIRAMHAERIRIESQLSQSRNEAERLKIERDQKSTQLEVMGQTLEGAAAEAKKSMLNVETLQMSLNQCAKDKQEWQKQEASMRHDLKTREYQISEMETQRSLERSSWNQERQRLQGDIESLNSQIKDAFRVQASQDDTIERFKRMELQWGLEKSSLQQAESNLKAQLAQTEEDLGYQIQSQEKSIQLAKETLNATEGSLNNRLVGVCMSLLQALRACHGFGPRCCVLVCVSKAVYTRPQPLPSLPAASRIVTRMHNSSSSSIYWHSNLVASLDWLRMLAHIYTLHNQI